MRKGGVAVAFVEFKDVCKVYRMGEVEVRALDGATFAVERGELAVILGPSGAGKTTLLNILGGIDTATSGEALLDGGDIVQMGERELTAHRRHDIGFVFQFYNLLANMTALENVEIATQLCRDPMPADEVLRAVGLGERLGNFPSELSGGEQQRVAIARALAKNPQLLLCDEPTGELDYQTGKQILKLLQDQSREKKMTVIIITHNSALTAMADRVIRVRSGRVESVNVCSNPTPVEQIEW
jgi:putative ABC transport system ATP-binding protein